MTSLALRLDSRALTPIYSQLSEILRQKIESQEWVPHQLIPSERELEALYKVSRTTVREAVTRLVNEGYLYRERGRGTFVARPKLEYSLHHLTSFTDDMKARGLEPGQRILSLKHLTASRRLRKQLELANGGNVIEIERLRLANGEPVGIHISYVPLPAGETIEREELEKEGSLYSFLQAKFGMFPLEADETIESTVADEHEAKLLRVKTNSPLLLIERTTWSREHRPMEFVKMLYRADRYKYYVHLTR